MATRLDWGCLAQRATHAKTCFDHLLSAPAQCRCAVQAPQIGCVAQSRLPRLMASWHDRTQDARQDHQLGRVQRRAEGTRVADDLVGQRHAVVRPCQWSQRSPADLLRRCHPVLPEHQMPVWPGPAPKPWLGRKPVGLAGLAWRVPDFSTLCRRQKTLRVQLPYQSSATALNSGHRKGARYVIQPPMKTSQNRGF